MDKTPPGLHVAEAHIWGLQISRGEAEQPDQARAPFLSHRKVEAGAGRDGAVRSLHFAEEENGLETPENLPRRSRRSVAELGLELSACGVHAPAVSPSVFLGAGTPEGSRPADRLLALGTSRGRLELEQADCGGSGPSESSPL